MFGALMMLGVATYLTRRHTASVVSNGFNSDETKLDHHIDPRDDHVNTLSMQLNAWEQSLVGWLKAHKPWASSQRRLPEVSPPQHPV